MSSLTICGHHVNQFVSGFVFPCIPLTTANAFTGGCFHLRSYQPGVLITRAGNDDACRLVFFLLHLIHSEEQELTMSQSEGSTEMQRGACHTLPSSSSQKGKQKKEHIRGKQLLVHKRRNKWLVFALLVLSLDSPYSLSARCCCIELE